MNNIIYSLILLGHGFKPFGYAIIDELLPFFIKFSKIKINLVSVFIILISTIIFFQSVKGLMINLSDYLYKFHMIWISICLLFLTNLETIDSKNRKIFYIATTYLLINLFFIIIQQINFLLSGGQFKCADLHHMTQYERKKYGGPSYQEDCFLDYAFWQEFWTGTSYSSLGMFISLILILSYLNKNKLKIFFISIFFFIIIFQESKTGLLYFILLTPFLITNKFEIKKFIYFVLFAVIILCSDLILTYLNHYFSETHDYYFSYVAKRTYLYGIVKELLEFLSTGKLAFLDDGRVNQIIGIKEYLVQHGFFENLLGTYSGSHRFNLINYITSDSSGILRPIGIVVLIYDWGLLFLFIYVSLVLHNLIKINFFTKHSIFKNLTISAVYLFISLNPLITNLNDSMLFWLIIFFPVNILVKSLMRVNI